ncbi:MAG: hypothetical protein IJU05_02860 [Schwartzia sp.]|nr:hypothetical protein [Schwartzia sp. (in: firmicutes)]
MELAVSFDRADALQIEKYAAARNMSVLDFVKRAVMKSVDEESERAAKNAEYLAMLDEGYRQLEKGQYISFTDEEWEKFVNGDPEVCAAKEAEHLALKKQIEEEKAAEANRTALAE